MKLFKLAGTTLYFLHTTRKTQADTCTTQKPSAPPPPNNSNCWQWFVPPPDGIVTFDDPEPQTGCDYAPCRKAVCNCDSYCCDMAWDLSCRGYYMESSDTQRQNYFVQGCSASELCCETPEAFPKPIPPQAAFPPQQQQQLVYNVYVEVKDTKTVNTAAAQPVLMTTIVQAQSMSSKSSKKGKGKGSRRAVRGR